MTRGSQRRRCLKWGRAWLGKKEGGVERQESERRASSQSWYQKHLPLPASSFFIMTFLIEPPVLLPALFTQPAHKGQVMLTWILSTQQHLWTSLSKSFINKHAESSEVTEWVDACSYVFIHLNLFFFGRGRCRCKLFREKKRKKKHGRGKM